MTFDWQTAIALMVVASAIGYLIFRVFGAKPNRDAGCGGCSSGCGNKSSGIMKSELVQLGESDHSGG